MEGAPVRMVLRWMEIGLGFSESREGRGRSSWSWLEDEEESETREEIESDLLSESVEEVFERFVGRRRG